MSGNINLQNNLQCIVLSLFPSEQVTDCAKMIQKTYGHVINGHMITLDGFNKSNLSIKTAVYKTCDKNNKNAILLSKFEK